MRISAGSVSKDSTSFTWRGTARRSVIRARPKAAAIAMGSFGIGPDLGKRYDSYFERSAGSRSAPAATIARARRVGSVVGVALRREPALPQPAGGVGAVAIGLLVAA